jgi:hypothetical protein
MSRKPCPSGKRGAYPSWWHAVPAAVRVSRVLGPVRAYECPHCGMWHLTRRPTWTER